LKQTRELGVEKQETYQPQLHELNMKVKAVLNELGIPAHLHHYYTSAGQEFWKLQKKGAEGPVNTEADGIAAGWVTRGLDFGVLQQVAALFGYNPRLMILESDCPAGVDLCDLNPEDVGDAPDPGISTKASRCDHVHKYYDPPTAYNVWKSALAYNSIVNPAHWQHVPYALYYLGWELLNNVYPGPAIGDELDYKFSHKAGAFTFVMVAERGGNMGIVTIYLDGVSQGTIDLYGAAGWTVVFTLPITILTHGEHTLAIRVTGKNDLSSNYMFGLNAWWLRD